MKQSKMIMKTVMQMVRNVHDKHDQRSEASVKSHSRFNLDYVILYATNTDQKCLV
jgi:hypothetical protein